MATLKQIAEEAGVSLFTVSRVLSGQAQQARISAERTATIQAIAKRLDFRPNAAARAMRTQKTRQVGVLIRNRPGRSRHTHPLAYETILGINEGLQAAGYVLSIIRVTDVEEAGRARVFKENVLDGMVVIDAMPDDVVDELQRRVKRVVWVDSNVWRPTQCIRRNEVHAGRITAEAALNLGYRKWVWAGLGPSPDRNYSLVDRLQGVREVAHANEIEVAELHLASGHANGIPEQTIDLLRPDTCLIAYGIYQARSLAHVAASVGLTAPHHFGLVCCDDSHDVHRMWPGLSRATFDRFEMGLASARMMMRMLEDDDATDTDNRSIKLRGHWHAGNTAWGPMGTFTSRYGG